MKQPRSRIELRRPALWPLMAVAVTFAFVALVVAGPMFCN